MFFSVLGIWIVLLLRLVKADDCGAGPVAQPVTLVGSGRPDSIGFCQTKWKQGLQVTGIEAWAVQWHITGLIMTYSDGTKDSIGVATDDGPHGDHQFLSWPADTPITDMTIASNKAGDGLGHLKFTVGGKQFEISSDHGDDKKVNVASGILLGASSLANGFVHQWAPGFLGTMNNQAVVTNMTFDQSLDELNKQQAGLEVMSLSEVYIQNTNPKGSKGKDSSYTFGVDVTRQMLVTDSNTQTHTFGFELAVTYAAEVDIPLIAKVSVTTELRAQYSYQSAATHTTTDSKTVTFRWTQGSSSKSDFIQPGRAKHCKAYAYQGHYEGPYTKTIQITVDGQQFTIQQRGTLDTISYSNASGSCEDIPISAIPPDAEVQNAQDTSSTTQAASTTTSKTQAAPTTTSKTQADPTTTSKKQAVPTTTSKKQAAPDTISKTQAVPFVA